MDRKPGSPCLAVLITPLLNFNIMKNVKKQQIQSVARTISSEKILAKSKLKQVKGGGGNAIVEENAEGF